MALDTLCQIPQFLDRVLTQWRGIALGFPFRLETSGLNFRHLRFQPPSGQSISRVLERVAAKGGSSKEKRNRLFHFQFQRPHKAHHHRALMLGQPMVVHKIRERLARPRKRLDFFSYDGCFHIAGSHVPGELIEESLANASEADKSSNSL
jgi:hypothetical protein